jgi:hypothetical protein
MLFQPRCKNKEISDIIFPLFYILQGTAQRFALLALGRTARSRPIGKMLRRRKLLENAAESPASSARFVGRKPICLVSKLRIV